MSRDGALRFWLEYVGREGGLVEERDDRALALLSAALRESLGLPEEVLVTTDPEVAEETSALLLIPGSPVLEAAATSVLERGDAGWRKLPWPRPSSLPDGRELLALSRGRVDVEHGRFELGGVPASVYLPVLHLGSLVTYTVDQPVQEREEAWVDARSGLALEAKAVEAVTFSDAEENAAVRHPCLRPDLARALQAAHCRIEQRAAERLRTLAREAEPRLAEELGRADTYFDAALESIGQRRERAPMERRALYDAQAEATRGERLRRRQEIEEKFRPRVRLQPFRLHLLLVPALRLPLRVRRGADSYPFEMAWLAPARAFAPYGCPYCGEEARLVAGRQRLGCVRCLPRPAPAMVPEPRSAGAPAPEVEVEPPAPRPRRKQASADRREPRPKRALPRPAPATVIEQLDPAERLALWERERAHICRAGDELVLAFWQRVAEGRPWRRVAASSPLAALYELYGSAGPLVAIGMPRGVLPDEVMGGIDKADFDLRGVSAGALTTAAGPWPFALLWRLVEGRAVVGEVLPSVVDPLGTLPGLGSLLPEVRENLRRPPAPKRRLDPVAGLLWEVETPRRGLTVAVRGVAAWWRVRGRMDVAGIGVEALAAALAHSVGKDSGLRQRREELAADYAVDAGALAKAVRWVRRASEPAG